MSATVSRSVSPDLAAGGTGARVAAVLVAGGVAWVILGPLAASVAVAVAVAAPRLVARRRRQASARRIDGDVATVLELAARQVRAGASVHDALLRSAEATAGPGGRLVLAMTRMSPGPDPIAARMLLPDQAGQGASRRRSSASDPTVTVVAAVIGMVGGVAGGGARGLEAGAGLLREHERARGEVLAAATHARTSAALLVAVPLVFGAASLVVLPASMHRVATDPTVIAPVLAGAAMEVGGAAWTARLVRSALGTA